MPVRVAHATSGTVAGVASDLLSQLGDAPNALVVYFASAAYPQAELAAALHGVLGAEHTIGCSTAGEITSGAVATNSVVVMALGPEDAGPMHAEMVPDLRDRAALDFALARFETRFGAPIRDLDPATHVGLVLMDGMSKGEEGFLDALGDRTDLLFVGGSAGDDLAFRETWVSLDGRAANHGGVLAILQPPRGFEIIKTQSFGQFGTELVATKVDEAARVVLEFNGQPAAQTYAAALGVSVADLPGTWMAHPLGLMADGEPFVRSPAQLTGDGVGFFCSVRPGTSLSVLASTDIVADTRRDLERGMQGGASALINFNCILRTLDLQARGQTKAYGEVFRDIPTIGFSTYGEAFVGHVNQTATMLLLR